VARYDSSRTDRPGSQANSFAAALLAVLLSTAGAAWYSYHQFLVDVPSRHIAVLTRKIGKDLSNTDEIAPTPEHKGIQQEVLTEGRYFFNPYVWSWEIVPQKEIPAGKLAVQIRLVGDDLPYGQFLAISDNQKGILPGVLNPGRYPINPYIYDIEDHHEPVTIDAGYKGVVTNLAGPLPENPNVLLVPPGFRGIQKEVLEPGTYYLNPYEKRVDKVDCRSQRFNLAEGRDMGFPSKDGFWVSLDGIIEFRVKPEMAAEVFVAYNEEKNGDSIDEELIRKVILPNARSFCRLEGSNSLGREFIQGATRQEFQDRFQAEMRAQCEPKGIEIIQALITRIKPPEQIAKPVRDRELAKQKEKQFQQQILQQKSEQMLAMEKELVNQKQQLVQAEQEVVQITTRALREQAVAVTKAQERLAVAQLKLEAARDEAAAITSKGKAAAEVVQFKNKAEAAGWKAAVAAFGGDGGQYAQYVLYQKMASAYRSIMVNTADSPIMKIFEEFTTAGQSSTRGSRGAPPSSAANRAADAP